MFPLTRQVQIATDFAARPAARLAGVEPPAVEDKETDFVELAARIDVRSPSCDTLPAGADRRLGDARDHADDRRHRRRPSTATTTCSCMRCRTSTSTSTTAYAILRHNGVELGKRDFIGAFS